MTRDSVLEARYVVKSFGATPALRGASATVGRGEILAIMGPSGSGKSTLLYCLAGILVPDSGQVVFDGTRIDIMPENRRSALRRDKFGFVFQFGQLVPELTAEENVALPLLLAGAAGARRCGVPASGSAGSASTALRGTGPRRCPAGRPSGWRSPAAWSPGPRSSSPTSPPARWTPSPASG